MSIFELGLSLKEARIRQMLTQSELASRTGVSLSTISGLERGSLPEIGVVKLLQLFAAVGLELQPRSAGQRRTLDDINTENARTGYARQKVLAASTKKMDAIKRSNERLAGNALKPTKLSSAETTKEFAQTRQRVRHAQKKDETK